MTFTYHLAHPGTGNAFPGDPNGAIHWKGRSQPDDWKNEKFTPDFHGRMNWRSWDCFRPNLTVSAGTPRVFQVRLAPF